MTNSAFYQFVLTLNAIWFFAGFWYFAIKREAATKLLVPKSARSSPIFETLTAALPFLGGMNLAFCLLAVIMLVRQDLFSAAPEKAVLLGIFGIAHASQFVINLPVAIRGGRIGESYWDVTRGPMFFIFGVDAIMMLLNLLLSILELTGPDVG